MFIYLQNRENESFGAARRQEGTQRESLTLFVFPPFLINASLPHTDRDKERVRSHGAGELL